MGGGSASTADPASMWLVLSSSIIICSIFKIFFVIFSIIHYCRPPSSVFFVIKMICKSTINAAHDLCQNNIKAFPNAGLTEQIFTWLNNVREVWLILVTFKKQFLCSHFATLFRPVTSRTTKNTKQDENEGITLKVDLLSFILCFFVF